MRLACHTDGGGGAEKEGGKERVHDTCGGEAKGSKTEECGGGAH